MRFREVNATNYAALEKALEDVDGSICITAEGLLMYFTDSVVGALCGMNGVVTEILSRTGFYSILNIIEGH